MASPTSPRPSKQKVSGTATVNPNDPAIIKQGQLVKQGGSYKSWKKRHFMLYGKNNYRNIVLTYHKKPSEPAIDELPLDGAYIDLPEPCTVLNFKPKNNSRVYPFKSPTDNTQELKDWHAVLLEYSFNLEEALFPGTTTTVATAHAFSLFEDKFGAKPGLMRALFNKIGVDYSGSSITRDAFGKFLRFVPPIRKEKPDNLGDSPNAELSVLATSPCGFTFSHWTRLVHQPWFFLNKDNLTVYQYLATRDIGSFVVRFGRFQDVFVLTVKTTIEIMHFPIVCSASGFSLGSDTAFSSIYALLRNYVVQPLPVGVCLTAFPVVAVEEVKVVESPTNTSIRKDISTTSPDSRKKDKKDKKEKKNSTKTSPVNPDAPPPSLPTVPDMEPPPTLSLPSTSEHILVGIHPTTSFANMSTVRLTTAFEVPTSTATSATEPWKVPTSLANADGWKTSKSGLCRRLLLQKGLKVIVQKELDQLSTILRILAPEGPIRIRKCYALDNNRLTTLFEANHSFLEVKLKSSLSEAPKWAANDPAGSRAETMQVLDQLASRCNWNAQKSLKIIPLIFFDSEQKLETVVSEGFDKTVENPDGPYGNGYYLTRSIDQARIKTNNGPFIIAFAVPGRTYPAIEYPVSPSDASSSNNNTAKKGRGSVSSAPATLYAKPVKEGYDSHFVRLCGSSKDDPQVGKPYYSGWKDQEWDDLVLFSMAQAIPRYLVYLE